MSKRKIATVTNQSGSRVAKVYRDAEWQEFVTKFFDNGVYLDKADAFNNEKADAIGTAENWVNQMKDFNPILRDQLAYVVNSGISVDMNSSFSTVSINCPESDGIFLHGDEADAFIDQARKLSESYTEETLHDCALIVAYPYADLF